MVIWPPLTFTTTQTDQWWYHGGDNKKPTILITNPAVAPRLPLFCSWNKCLGMGQTHLVKYPDLLLKIQFLLKLFVKYMMTTRSALPFYTHSLVFLSVSLLFCDQNVKLSNGIKCSCSLLSGPTNNSQLFMSFSPGPGEAVVVILFLKNTSQAKLFSSATFIIMEISY